MTRTVFVLGHKGMLGHVVARRAKELGWEVMTSETRIEKERPFALPDEVAAANPDVIVNCLGRTPQAGGGADEMMAVNTGLLFALRGRMRDHQYLIHASTDCVFPPTGGHTVDDRPYAGPEDLYAATKIAAEMVRTGSNVTVIRVSVVGLSPNNGRGLLEWFLRYPEGQPVPGWTDHRWNGITTLSWADVALAMAAARIGGEKLTGVVQPGIEPITKYDLLCAFRQQFRPNCEVAPVVSGRPIDRTLIPTLDCPLIAHQLKGFAAWYGRA